MKPLLLQALCIAALAAATTPHAVAAQSGVYSPAKEVLCDKPSGFCADGTGISASWTDKYLGAAAAKRLADMIGDGKNFDGTVFTMSNRVHCDIKAQVCTKDKLSDEVEPKATKVLFGKLPAVAKASKDIGFPAAGVICDKKSNFCVDAKGISMAATQQHLGAAVAQKFEKMNGPLKDMDTTRYVLSNGVDCDSAKKVCMAERRGTEVERRYTRHLFGQ
jgi:hypothetical protein